jgi:hypothetical protein
MAKERYTNHRAFLLKILERADSERRSKEEKQSESASRKKDGAKISLRCRGLSLDI